MGWLPGAVKRDVGAPGNYSNGPMRSYTGVVLHVNDADSGDLFDWITGNNGMSCHWQVTKDGTVYQYIDTAYSSWCQADGNDDYLSIETSGLPAEPLTDAQLHACALIMAYASTQHGIPLLLADSPGWRGLGWHGMGGAAWGGHTSCPGDLRKAQRSQILGAAAVLTGRRPQPVQEGPFMALSDQQQADLAHQVGVTDANVKLIASWVQSNLLRTASLQAAMDAQAATLTALQTAVTALHNAPAGTVDLTPVTEAIDKLPADIRAVFESQPLTIGGTAK